MSNSIKRKLQLVRSEFKADLFQAAKNNKAFAMMIVSAYSASRHRTHIGKIWELLGFRHKEAYRDYCDKLAGQMLSGGDEIMRSIYFADKDLYDKYARKIPECYAMGDALAVAYAVLKKTDG